MKKMFVMVVAVLLVLMPIASLAEVDFVIGAYPLSFLNSPDAEDFSAAEMTGPFSFRTERVDGETSWIPSIVGGIGIDTPAAYIDLTIGGGYANGGDVYTAGFFLADLAARFKVYDSSTRVSTGTIVTFGPHASVIYFDPKYKGDIDVELEETAGFIIGPAFTIGKKSISFSASVDYVYLPVDVKSKPGIFTSDDELDLSGIAVQMGVLFRF